MIVTIFLQKADQMNQITEIYIIIMTRLKLEHQHGPFKATLTHFVRGYQFAPAPADDRSVSGRSIASLHSVYGKIGFLMIVSNVTCKEFMLYRQLF